MGVIERLWVTRARVQAACEVVISAASRRLMGQSTVEYALVGALVVIAAAGALTLLGGEITNVFSRITNTLSGTAPSGH